MVRRKKRSGGVYFERRLLDSLAFRSLRRPASYVVLVVFWLRRRMEKQGPPGRETWCVANNGDIRFSYREAKQRYGLSPCVFRNAVDDLRDKGFLDIAASGAGLYKSANLYAISDRWREYGTPDYEPPAPRPKGPINRGFGRGNRLGRNCRKASGPNPAKDAPEKSAEYTRLGSTSSVHSYENVKWVRSKNAVV